MYGVHNCLARPHVYRAVLQEFDLPGQLALRVMQLAQLVGGPTNNID